MSSNNRILLILCVILAIGLEACTKKKAPETAYGRIQGKWKLTKTASDDNLNARLDYYELTEVPDVQDYQMLFNNEGKGVTTSTFDGKKSPDLKFNWEIVHGDSVRIIYAANDTITYHLANITSSELLLARLGDITTEWLYFNKK